MNMLPIKLNSNTSVGSLGACLAIGAAGGALLSLLETPFWATLIAAIAVAGAMFAKWRGGPAAPASGGGVIAGWLLFPIVLWALSWLVPLEWT